MAGDWNSKLEILEFSRNSISIVLATCNGEKYLKEQLESLANQTVPPMEIVVSDDCSSDATQAVVHSFIQNAPFPVYLYINHTRLGYRENFFQAARLSRGMYIAFCDQDDIWHPEKIELVAREIIASSRKVDVALHPAWIFHEEEKTATETFPANLLKPGIYLPLKLNILQTIPGNSIVASRELVYLAMRLQLLLSENSPVSRGHDDLVYFMGTVAGVTQILCQPLVFWRQHSGNTCGLPNPILQHGALRISHLKLMTDLSGRWFNLSTALAALAYEAHVDYSKNLRKSSRYLRRRGQYFAQRAMVSDSSRDYFSRVLALLKAHSCYSYFSGLGLSCARAMFRDVLTLIYPQLLGGLIKPSGK